MKRTFAGYLNQAAYNLLPEDIYMFILFRAKCGYFWNMKDPKTFREKMYLLLRYYKHNPQLAQIVSDKYTVEEYVAQKIGEEYLVKLLAHFPDAESFSKEGLPNEFVIKVTQSTGENIIVYNKEELNEEETRKQLAIWMRNSAAKVKSDIHAFHYDGKPSIIVEELLKPADNKPLNDYKLYCINGEVIFTRVAIDPIDEKGLRKKKFVYNTYDKDWNFIDFNTGNEHGSDASVIVEKPEAIDEMYRVAEKLSEDFPFARIDLYIVDGKIYFGEITLFPGSFDAKMTPDSWDAFLGDKLNIQGYV